MQIVTLGKFHQRDQFNCGIDGLNIYLHKYARQDMQRRLAAVFVLTGHESAVLGYYTLSATRIDLGDLPEDMRTKLPQYPSVPAVLLGRLAVDSSIKGKGFGELLLVDGIKRSINNEIASMAMVVDAKDKNASSFYARYGFKMFKDEPSKMFIPFSTLSQLGL